MKGREGRKEGEKVNGLDKKRKGWESKERREGQEGGREQIGKNWKLKRKKES